MLLSALHLYFYTSVFQLVLTIKMTILSYLLLINTTAFKLHKPNKISITKNVVTSSDSNYEKS